MEEFLDNKIESEWGLRTAVPLTYKIVDSKYTGSLARPRVNSETTASGSDSGSGTLDDLGPLIDSCSSLVHTHFSY
jgi:hypothetical protein